MSVINIIILIICIPPILYLGFGIIIGVIKKGLREIKEINNKGDI